MSIYREAVTVVHVSGWRVGTFQCNIIPGVGDHLDFRGGIYEVVKVTHLFDWTNNINHIYGNQDTTVTIKDLEEL